MTKQIIMCPICGHLTSDYFIGCTDGKISDIICSNKGMCFFSSNYVPFSQWSHLLKLRQSRDNLFTESTNKSMKLSSLEADNARLNRALDVLCELLVHHEVSDCPVLSCLQEKSAKCNNCKITVNAIPCWREYALAEAEEKKP
jgi:hypothetical protein